MRVGWLAARVAEGLERKAEAVAGLERVHQRLTEVKRPYEAAFSGLDLSVLWLEAGSTSDVRQLALTMAWIFGAKGIRSEALAALQLFHEAARCEAATVALARRVIADIETTRRLAPLRTLEEEAHGSG